MQPAAGVRRQASQDDEMVRSRFRAAGLLSSSSSFTTAATRRAPPAAGEGSSSSLMELEPSASSLLLASSHSPIDNVRSHPVCCCVSCFLV
ncbi:hypothetical protein Zm00014a_043349 [Zea mays]|uniref:Uncharacterized protein n=1 Tax=Zea mays TaxID=4577 RepID=A0A3L6DF30_MAIZE|nr:hypothetical protein Zm00014a_043349 [Zea mays]